MARSSFRRVERPIGTLAVPAAPWAGIESTDTRQLIANLRALGCPEDTIRDLVVSRICRSYRNRLLAVEAEAARSWDFTRGRSRQDRQERRVQRSRLRDEMMNELEDLLGQPAGRLTFALLGWSERGEPEFLKLEKRRQVREIQQRYRMQIEEVESRGFSGDLDDEARTRLKEFKRQQEAEIDALLTPQEREERLCRESDASRYVRQNLPQAKSEGEFRQIVRLAAEFDLADHPSSMAVRYGQPNTDTDPMVKEYEQRKAVFDQRLKDLLGVDRIAEQQAAEQARMERERKVENQRSEQQAREMAESMAAEVGVAAADANRFMDRMLEQQSTLQKRFEELERTLTGTPEEIRTQMDAAVKAELEQMAVETMGEKGREFVRKMSEREGQH